jgi:pyruvate kinase
MEPIFTIDHHYSNEMLVQLGTLGIRYLRINPARIGLCRALALIENVRTHLTNATLFIDTCGAKHRIATREKVIELSRQVQIGTGDDADLMVSEDFFLQLRLGDILVIMTHDDSVTIKIEKIFQDVALGYCEGGIVHNHAHIRFLDRVYINRFLFQEDIRILAAFSDGVNIGLSFADTPELVCEARQHTNSFIYAKIESTAGVENINKILDVADGIIIARDDLAKAVGETQLDAVSQVLVQRCLYHEKPFIPASNLFLDLCSGDRMQPHSQMRIARYKELGAPYLYCNESVICPNMRMLEKICEICRM